MTELEGDPVALAKEASDFHRMSISIQNASSDLRDLTSGQVYISKAIDKLDERARDVAVDTNKLFARYDGLADALSTYSKKLQAAKERARNAIINYNRSDVDAYNAQHLDRHYEEAEKEPGADPATLAAQRKQTQDDLRDAVQARQHAESEWAAAVKDRDVAAQEAIEAIKEAQTKSGLNDTFKDDVKGALDKFYKWCQENVAPVLEKLKELAKIIGDIMGPIALLFTILSFIPGLNFLFGPLAAIANAIVLITTVVAILSSLLLTALGKQSLGEFLKDAIKFGTKVVLSKVGGALGEKVGGKVADLLIETGSKRVTAEILDHVTDEVAEHAVDTIADMIEPHTDPFLDQFVEGTGFNDVFAPETQTADWNPPVIPDIAPVVVPDAPGAGWLGENVVDPAVQGATALAETRPSPAIPVSAGGGGSW